MPDDPLDAMKARWNHIQGTLFPWLREEVDPMTEALGRLVTTLDVIGLEAFVPEPPRGPGRPPEDRRALARAFVAKAMLGIPTTSALIERLAVDKSLRRILGWERRSQAPSEATFSRAFAEFARGDLPDKMHAALSSARSAGASTADQILRVASVSLSRRRPQSKTTGNSLPSGNSARGSKVSRFFGTAGILGIQVSARELNTSSRWTAGMLSRRANTMKSMAPMTIWKPYLTRTGTC